MKYPDKLYIEFKKTVINQRDGFSNGQITMIRNFKRGVNISRRQDHPRSGINYRMTKFKDYPDMLEVEFTRLDKIKK